MGKFGTTTFTDGALKNTSFEDFQKDHDHITFRNTDGTVIEKKEMFKKMGGSLKNGKSKKGDE